MDSRCLVLTVVPRRGNQRCTNYISVFIFVRHVFMSSLLIKPIGQHHRSRVSPVLPREFPLHLWGNLTVKDPTQHSINDWKYFSKREIEILEAGNWADLSVRSVNPCKVMGCKLVNFIQDGWSQGNRDSAASGMVAFSKIILISQGGHSRRCLGRYGNKATDMLMTGFQAVG